MWLSFSVTRWKPGFARHYPFISNQEGRGGDGIRMTTQVMPGPKEMEIPVEVGDVFSAQHMHQKS